jgi:2,4-dienoyl-CoA reductase-like NADH-dependent reductase (Old Yellow Enzyme family)
MTLPNQQHHVTIARVPSARTAKLFEPFQIGCLALKNRLVMAPMTRTMSPGGVPGPANAAYYRRRAKGGVGLIVTEGTWVDRAGANEEDVPRLFGEAALSGWSHVVNEVHKEGAPIFCQLWHVGQMKQPVIEGLYDAKADDLVEPRRTGPSGLFGGLGSQTTHDGEPASQADLDRVVEAFGAAAVNAQRVGFDGVEIHAAHGYLFDQFFWEETNRRTDKYGGSMRNRIRLAVDTVAEIRRLTGPDFPISLRISQWKIQDFGARIFQTPAELKEFVGPFTDAGVNIFHCSQRRFWEGDFGTDFNLASWTKRASGKPSISVGSVAMTSEHVETLMGKSSDVAGIDRLLAVMDRGDFDLIAVGRAILADPEWAEKVRNGRLDQLLPWSPEVLKTLS